MSDKVVHLDSKRKKPASVRMDGMGQIFNSLGGNSMLQTMAAGGNTYRGTSSLTTRPMSDGELEFLYNRKGIAATIVDRPADDCLANGVTIEGDVDNIIRQEFERLEVIPRFTEAVRWARLFGGALIHMVVRDGRGQNMPLDEDNIGEVIALRVYPVRDVSNYQGMVYVNQNHPRYGMPVRYLIKTTHGADVVVHESRCLIVPGDPSASHANRRNLPWAGKPVLSAVVEDLDRYGKGLFWSLRLLERKQQAVHKMAGLADTLADDGEEGERAVYERLRLVDQSRNALNSVAVDADDDYSIANLGMDGVSDSIGEFKVALSTSAAMPVTVLFGTSPTGLSATGEGELQSYYKKVSHDSNRKLRGPFERMVTILWRQETIETAEPDDWRVEFNPLWLPAPKEAAEAEHKRKQAFTEFVKGVNDLVEKALIGRAEGRRMVQLAFPEYPIVGDELPPEPKPDPTPAPRPASS